MPRFKVNREFRSYNDGQWYGHWPEGQIVDLTEDEAAWVNRASPGTLSPEKPAAKPQPVPVESAASEQPAEADEPQRARKPARNRQHRGGQNRAD